MKKKLCLLAMALGLICFFAAGSLAENEKKGSSTLEFKILTEKNIYGSFSSKSGRILHFEAIRGEANDLNIDPEAPLFVLDIRILDDKFQPFLVRTGGARPLDPWWYEDQKELEKKEEQESGSCFSSTQEEERLLDFLAVPELAMELKDFQIRSRNKLWIISELIVFSEEVDIGDLYDQNFSDKNEQKMTFSATYYYKHRGKIKWKSINNAGGLANHSAFSLEIYSSSGALKYKIYTCNHGTCASDYSMITACSKEWLRTNTKIYIWDKMCDGLTPYGVHVCHDDTELQYYSTKNQNFDGAKAWSICGSPSLNVPACN